jgi:hypothetical protein
MNAIVVVSSLLVLASATGKPATDTYSMTYQAAGAGHTTTVPILSFTIARQTRQAALSGPGSAQRRQTEPPTNSGQIKILVDKNAREIATAFKKGAVLHQITIVMTGITPAGAMAPMRHWVLTDAMVDSFAVTGTGQSAQSILGLHWKSMTTSTP